MAQNHTVRAQSAVIAQVALVAQVALATQVGRGCTWSLLAAVVAVPAEAVPREQPTVLPRVVPDSAICFA